MNEKTIKDRTKYEKNRIVRLLKAAGTSEDKIKALQPIIQNTAALKAKLDDIQDEMLDADTLVEYEHGGGQSGIKENPIFKLYSSMLGSYTAGMKIIFDYMPAEAVTAKKGNDDTNVLQFVRSKHIKKA